MSDVIFHSSGSTGDAKSIVRSESSLLDDAAHLVLSFSDVWRDRPLVVPTVRPEHMYGALWTVRAPRIAGCAVHPAIVVSVEELLGIASSYAKILLITTPSFLDKARRHPDFPLLRGKFHDIVTSGSMLAGETSRAVAEATGTCPLEIYGSTEAGTVAWRRRSKGDFWTLADRVAAVANDDGLIAVDSPFAMSRPIVMGDRVEFVDSRHFLLRGRADRKVKILERFVSLEKVEQAIGSHPFVSRIRVEAYGEGVPRLGALVELADGGATAIASETLAQGAAILREHAAVMLEPNELPRRIRFVRTLPANSQGKTTVSAVVDALSAWCQEPIVLSWQATASRLSARLAFPADMTCFKGHFPGFPVLPGVAQLYFLRHFARQAFVDFPDVCTFRKLKFKKIVVPGSTIDLTVVRKDCGMFEFTFGEASQGEVLAK